MDNNKIVTLIEENFGIDYLGFLEEVEDPAEYIGSRFIPDKTAFDYDWVYHIFDNTVAMAKLMARGDSEAPIIGGPAVKKVAGSVVPFGQKFEVNKSILNKIFNPRNDNELKSNLRQILDESARNIRSAQSRREWLKFQVLANPAIVFKDKENNDLLSIDFGRKNELEVAVGALEGGPWDGSGATPKPLTDLTKSCETYYTVNKSMPDVILMRRAQVLQLTNSAEVAGEFEGTATRISLNRLNDYLVANGYPAIETYDNFVRIEDSKGRATGTEFLIPAGRVLFLKESQGQEITDIGRLVMGPVAENNFQPGIFTTIYEEFDPTKYWHYMKTEMFPAVHNPDLSMFMDVVA